MYRDNQGNIYKVMPMIMPGEQVESWKIRWQRKGGLWWEIVQGTMTYSRRADALYALHRMAKRKGWTPSAGEDGS